MIGLLYKDRHCNRYMVRGGINDFGIWTCAVMCRRAFPPRANWSPVKGMKERHTYAEALKDFGRLIRRRGLIRIKRRWEI
jgi:hypothetical protein